MNNYLLNSEKKRINTLLDHLEKVLYKSNRLELENTFSDIIKNNKDANITDILNYYLDLLIQEMNPLLEKHLTQGLQFGIKNNNFEVLAYGGYTSINKINEINKNTMFSFDSISKIITSIITMTQRRKNIIDLSKPINNYNKDYQLDATIESILKFTAYIKTKKRIDNLSKEETINLLKECKENIQEKNQYKNFYEYNDIGFMILRQIIPNFLNELDSLLEKIDNQNLTYHNRINNMTGGKMNHENITPDPKGKDILFPGHTGLYGNIEGLINLFDKLTHTEILLTEDEKQILWKQPYEDPIIYNKNNSQPTHKKIQYTNKIAGIYKMPNGINPPYNKISLCDIPNSTTNNAKSSAGTCGSWVISDNITTNNMFGYYTAGILTNPYSYVEEKIYEEERNKLNNTPLEVTPKGTIINYSKTLNPYKEIITNYAIILELLTEYIKETEKDSIINKKLIKKI